MVLKSLDELSSLIDGAVNPYGLPPKTTGPGLHFVLQTLASEITTLPLVLNAQPAPSPAPAPAVVLAATLAELPAAGQAGTLYVLTGVAPATSPVLYHWQVATGQYAPVLPAPAGPQPAPVRVRGAFGNSQPITFDQDTDFELPDGSVLTEGFDAAGSAVAFSFAGAVRGATVRVPYYSAQPFTLPASFNLLTGPVLTDNVKAVFYFRYVRDNVVDVTAGASQPGTYVARFWALPGAADLGLGFYMSVDAQVLAVSSEGRKVRAGAFNGAGPGVRFEATSGPRYADVFLFEGSFVLPRIDGVTSGIGPVAGELNLDFLPNLTELGLLQFSRGYTKVIAHKPTLELLIGFRYEQTPLDLGQCVVRRLDAGSSYCSALVLPPAGDSLTYLNLVEHRLYNQDLVFPSLPKLNFLDLSVGQAYVGRLNQVDISQLPGLSRFATQQASLQRLVIGDNPLAELVEVNCAQGRLTGRAEPFGGGTFATVTQLVQRAHRLASLNLGLNGLSEDELDALLDALVAARPQAAPGPKILQLADYPGEAAFRFGDNGYPHPYNHDPNFGFAYNAPVVRQATRSQIAQLRAGGWQVTYNQLVPLRVEYVSATRFRAAYQGPADLDVWAVGDTLPLQSNNDQCVPAGTYQVVGGGGRTWELAPLAGQPALNSFPVESGNEVWVAGLPPAYVEAAAQAE